MWRESGRPGKRAGHCRYTEMNSRSREHRPGRGELPQGLILTSSDGDRAFQIILTLFFFLLSQAKNCKRYKTKSLHVLTSFLHSKDHHCLVSVYPKTCIRIKAFKINIYCFATTNEIT